MLRLTLIRYKVDGSSLVKNGGVDDFVAMINPDGYTISSGIRYGSTAGSSNSTSGSEPKYTSTLSDTIKINAMILDGTGVVPDSASVKVVDRITHLRKLAFDYVGDQHEPPVVELSWGTFHFFARLTDLKIDYTLFSADGEALRAKVDLTFVEYKTQAEIQKMLNRSSPDLTHLVEVLAGDNLPLMCHRIYKDSSHYLDVARANNLTDLRNLVPGTRLHFPPLRK